MGFDLPAFHAGDPAGTFDSDGKLRVGEKFTRSLNAIIGELKRRRKVAVAPPLTFSDGPDGRAFGLSVPKKIWGKLAGSSSPYSFAQQEWNGTAWQDAAGGIRGTAYEANGLPALNGKVVRLVPGAKTEWLFQWYGVGCVNSKVTTTTADCNGPLSGVAITLYQGGALQTLTSKVFGSGYTSAPTCNVIGDGSCAAVRAVFSSGSGSGNTTSTGTPSTLANDATVGTETWNIPGALGIADVSLSGADNTKYLKVTGFSGLSGVPSGATITGLKATVTGNLTDDRALDWHVKWVKGGAISGSDLAPGSPGGDISGGTLVYGGSTDTGGLSLVGSDVTASNFGIVLSFQLGSHSDTVTISNIVIEVWWNDPGGITDFVIDDGGLGYVMPGTTISLCGGGGTGASVAVGTVSARTTAGTCTTATGVQSIILNYDGILAPGGSGYTNGTGYALSFTGGGGTGAAGTFDVVGGKIKNVALTAGGSGYTSTPTPVWSAAGTPTRAAVATVTIGATCDTTISSAGTYLVRGVAGDGRVRAQCLNLPCPFAGVSLNMSYYDFRVQDCHGNGLSGATVEVFYGCISLGSTTSDASGIARIVPSLAAVPTFVSVTYEGVTNTKTASGFPFPGWRFNVLGYCTPLVFKLVTELGATGVHDLCNAGAPLSGATVTFAKHSDSTSLGTGTTDATGTITPISLSAPLDQTDSVDYTISKTGFESTSGTIAASFWLSNCVVDLDSFLLHTGNNCA